MQISDLTSDYKRIFKFGLIGLSGVVVNNGLLWLLVKLNLLPFYLCSFIAIEISIITNFLLNDAWTWADRRQGHKLQRLFKYNLSTAFSSVFINITILLFLKEWLGMPYLLANLIGIGCGMLFNFFINHFWTYGELRFHLPNRVWWVLFFSLIWRLTIAAFIGAGFDEAYYYSYAIRPALSYFDHPPFVGFLAGFFPYLTNFPSAFTIRLGSVFLFTLSGLILYILARRLASEREAFYAYVLFNLTPLFMLGAGTMILPDVGLVFFWTLALLILEQLFIRENFSLQNWIIAGILTGFAMLSKYHGVLLGSSVVLFLLLRHPRQFLRPGPWIYGAAAFLIFSPVIIWNVQNDFVSFVFQGGRAVGGNLSFSRFFQALGGQIAYLTPFIFFPIFLIVYKVLKNTIKNWDASHLFFAIFGVLPIFLMLTISFFKQILPHWTLPGYIILMVPLGQWLATKIQSSRIVRFTSQFTLGFIFIILSLAALHTRFGIFHLEKMAEKGWVSLKDVRMDATLDAFGWDEVRNYIFKKYAQKDIFLFTNKWFLSGEVDLAVQGKYPVMCFNETDSRGFGIWDAQQDMRGKDGVLISSNRYPTKAQEKYSAYFQNISRPDSVLVTRGSAPAKVYYFYHCKNLLKKYPVPYQKLPTQENHLNASEEVRGTSKSHFTGK